MNADKIADLLDATICSLCRFPEKVEIGLEELRNSVFLSIKVDREDQAKVVGSKGVTINAIKKIFETAQVIDKKNYHSKSIKVFLESPGGKRSTPEKFNENKDFDANPYVQLLGNLVSLFSDTQLSTAEISGVHILEVTTHKEVDPEIQEAIKWIITSAAKCNGGAIEITYV